MLSSPIKLTWTSAARPARSISGSIKRGAFLSSPYLLYAGTTSFKSCRDMPLRG